MTRVVDLAGFAAADDAFAIRFTREDLPGLLRKRLEVPRSTVALVRNDAGEARVLQAGGESYEAAQGLLVRERCRFRVEQDALRSQDDLNFRASVELEVGPRSNAIDLAQLERALLKDQPGARTGDVQAYFAPYVRDALRLFVGKAQAAAIMTEDQRTALEAHLGRELERPLFEAGLVLHAALHPSFASPDWEERRRVAAEASVRMAALEEERRLLEARKQLDRVAVLKDIEVRDEADRQRKERRLQRYEEIRARMGDDDLKALVLLLDDDRQRASLIRDLITKDMTDEQRAGMQVAELQQRVEERLAELQQRLAQLTGGGLERRETDPITRRLLCVVGKRVLSFDPKTNLHPEVPKEVHDTEGGSLGYLRSARSERIDGREWLLIGAQRGVYRLGEGEGERHELVFPRELEGKGGANAVAYFDGRVFATHSELGLCEWPLEGGPGRLLCADVTSGASATRGATVLDGRLYFSAGAEVHSLDLALGSEKPTRFRGSDDSITSFVVLRDELVAGNRSGRIYRWSLDDPGSPEAFNVVKKNPIYMLRHAQIAGQGFFLIGSKDFTLTAAEPRRDVYREYQAREEVRWVDGAADFVFGVSRSGYKVFCWDAHRQAEPKLTIRVSDKVQDLFVARTLPSARG